MEKISILIVDDHQLFRNGLKFILSESEDFEIVAEASNGEEFIKLIKNVVPDIVLMDINMPLMNGIDASRKALAMYPDLKIVVLSMYDDEQYYNSLIELGVKGFLLKDATSDELKTGILRIYNNHTYFSQELLIKIIKNKENSVDVNITEINKGLFYIGYNKNINETKGGRNNLRKFKKNLRKMPKRKSRIFSWLATFKS